MSYKNLSSIIGDPIVFLDQIFSKLEDIGLAVDKYELDHICFRVKTIAEYKEKKEELNEFGVLLVESMVGGRLISTFKLHEPIVFQERKISLLELPAPKPTHSYPTGLEHVEFVTKEPLQKIVDRYPQYSFQVFGINKKINADITLVLGEHCIRFHNQSLEEIIKFEKKLYTKR